jgi:hypothetical protein
VEEVSGEGKDLRLSCFSVQAGPPITAHASAALGRGDLPWPAEPPALGASRNDDGSDGRCSDLRSRGIRGAFEGSAARGKCVGAACRCRTRVVVPGFRELLASMLRFKGLLDCDPVPLVRDGIPISTLWYDGQI